LAAIPFGGVFIWRDRLGDAAGAEMLRAQNQKRQEKTPHKAGL